MTFHHTHGVWISFEKLFAKYDRYNNNDTPNGESNFCIDTSKKPLMYSTQTHFIVVSGKNSQTAFFNYHGLYTFGP